MTAHFKIGDRVKYIGEWRIMQGITGTVRRVYEGYWFADDDTGLAWTPAHYSVQVDKIPEEWPYTGTDRFAPSGDELALVKEM